MSCLFCKIVAGDIPANTVYSDEHLLAFRDVNPQAPFHVLVIPRRHIPTTNDIVSDEASLVGELLLRGAALARAHGYEDSGYRLVLNCNADAGQSVPHVHLHVLAGRRMSWPPG